MKQRIKHRKKLRLARRMRTRKEIKDRVGPFDSRAWNERKENRATKVRNLEVAAGWRKKNKYESNK